MTKQEIKEVFSRLTRIEEHIKAIEEKFDDILPQHQKNISFRQVTKGILGFIITFLSILSGYIFLFK